MRILFEWIFLAVTAYTTLLGPHSKHARHNFILEIKKIIPVKKKKVVELVNWNEILSLLSFFGNLTPIINVRSIR